MNFGPKPAAVVMLPVPVEDVRKLSVLTDEILELTGRTLTAHSFGLDEQVREFHALAKAKAEELVALADLIAASRRPPPERPRPALTLRRAA